MLYITGWQKSTRDVMYVFHCYLPWHQGLKFRDGGLAVRNLLSVLNSLWFSLYSPFLHTRSSILPRSSPVYLSVLPATGSGSVTSWPWDWQHFVPNQLSCLLFGVIRWVVVHIQLTVWSLLIYHLGLFYFIDQPYPFNLVKVTCDSLFYYYSVRLHCMSTVQPSSSHSTISPHAAITRTCYIILCALFISSVHTH